MKRLPAWRRYARFWGPRVIDDVDDELAFHLDMLVRDYVARGLDEPAARRAAEARLGDRERARSRCITIGERRNRRMRRVRTIDALFQDIRFALRTLHRQKGWTTVALLTMALGIGASTTMFSAVHSLILDPLPYRHGDRVVMLWRSDARTGIMIPPSEQMLAAAEAQTNLFEDFFEFASARLTMTGRGEPMPVSIGKVSTNFVAFTGVPLLAGRGFTADEGQVGGPRVALIGEGIWRERFGGLPSAIGQLITFDDVAYTIVGVAPARLGLPSPAGVDAVDAWLPLVKDSTAILGVVAARLRPGVSPIDATQQIDRVVARDHLAPTTRGPLAAGMTTRLVRPGDLLNFRTSLFLLSGAVALLLIVACANVAHLLLARGATREREMAIRVAVGAGRRRLARQLLTESAVLAGAGCVLGILVAYIGVQVLQNFRPEALSVLGRTTLDATALWTAVALSAVAGLAFGCAAAIHAVRHANTDVLRMSAQLSAGRRATAVRSILVVTEMALSAMLLVGATLLVRSVVALQHVDVGFDTRGLYTMSLDLPRRYYTSGPARRAFVDGIIDAARHIPAVDSVTASSATPPNLGGFAAARVEVEGRATPAESSLLPTNFVLPSYFGTLGIALDGATFGPSAADENDVIINRGFANKYFSGERAVGRRFRFGSSGKGPNDGWMRIVGVAENVAARGLSADPGDPFLYRPIGRTNSLSRWAITVHARPGTDPTVPLRSIVATMDARLVPPPVSTVASDLSRSIASQRFTMLLLAAFAVTAVLLSAIGLFGVMSYAVTQRTREIGIRVALGATEARVAKMILVRGLALSIAGMIAGLTLATWGTRLISASLFGIAPSDPLSYAAAGLVLLAVSVVACGAPVRRATRVDPIIAMRGE